MNTDLRTVGIKDTRASTLKRLLYLIVLTTAGCGDLAPNAMNADVPLQVELSTPGATLHTTTRENASHVATTLPAARTDQITMNPFAISSGDKARVVFLHGLHSPFSMALAMARIPTTR